MNLLAIDTSTECASVALLANGELAYEEQGTLRQHAQLLLPIIESLLAKAEMSCSQLDAIVFGRGPGSFTGLRIACSVAKGLAYAHDLPLYPVSSLASVAYEVYQLEAADVGVLAMIDARMQQVYCGYFTGETFDAQESVLSPADILLPPQKPLILAGVGLESYGSQLPQALQATISKQCTIFPHAKTMIALVEAGKIKAVSAAEALPVYVRNQVTQGESGG